MKAVILMFDTLSRRFLSTFGNDWVPTPNFDRLEKNTAVFDNFYCGSLPCMPARRELHTGRYNFLHRSWGPIEPFDDSCFEILKDNGVYTHIVTDHSHYWEDGGATYLTRYNSWEGFRGQEGDRWMPVIDKENLGIPKLHESNKKSLSLYHNYSNRLMQQTEEEMSSVKTIMAGVEFLEKHHGFDNWCLQIECFDPHEPFFVPQKYLDRVNDNYKGDYFDWPAYKQVTESEEEKEHLIKRYAALITMCDEYLGKVLDVMDKHNMWDDTMLIVHTDHGFLMGEHNWWGKNVQPQYQEICHIPLYLHLPGKELDKRVDYLTQTIDIAPTLLDFFGCDIPGTMQGKSIIKALENNEPVREAGLYGVFGGHVNVVTKNHVYMRANVNSDNTPLYQYTLMPTNMRGFFDKDSLMKAELTDEFSFTKDIPVLKVPAKSYFASNKYGSLLFDLKNDYSQNYPLKDPELEEKMIDLLRDLLIDSEADDAQFERLGIKIEKN